MTAEERAPAKINLALHVTGRRDDGYHLLDSIVAFTDLGDRLIAEPAERFSLRVTGPRGAGVPEGESNLAYRAAALYGPPACALTLEKVLPSMAGIGGGSADAAATLRLLTRLEGADLPGGEDVFALGADVPVCLAGRPARMRGAGEIVEPLAALPPLHGVLVNTGEPVETGRVFKALTRVENTPLADLPGRDASAAEFIDWLSRQRNDLEMPARGVAPGIGVALSRLSEAGAALARMSGSGGTCFGLWHSRTEAEDAAAALARATPRWWVQAISFAV